VPIKKKLVRVLNYNEADFICVHTREAQIPFTLKVTESRETQNVRIVKMISLFFFFADINLALIQMFKLYL